MRIATSWGGQNRCHLEFVVIVVTGVKFVVIVVTGLEFVVIVVIGVKFVVIVVTAGGRAGRGWRTDLTPGPFPEREGVPK